MFQKINHNSHGFKVAFSIQTVLIVLLFVNHFTGVEGFIEAVVFYGVVFIFFVLAYLTYKDQSKAGKQR
ncbi:hypothetical protein RYX45_05895 [Alkalihalophilus pseudofirmus]|uniref:Uncharacterized protein n=1 Tax=Alkalihalophilus pseudofirmus TaxID=79885 RepID=A0AAJ2KUF5_ALKPS|nr:hypothetical protein [Alkalihalophilus pseudofirmus]MDV2884702.1 hypothetical protein [Alkalihalophilus pseudofirmus]